MDLAPVTETVRRLNPRSDGHSGDRRRTAVAQLVITPDLMRLNMALCHSKFHGEGCIPILPCSGP